MYLDQPWLSWFANPLEQGEEALNQSQVVLSDVSTFGTDLRFS